MIWLGLLCLLAGAVLGLLFTAYVLIPATVLSLTAVVGLGLVNGLGPWEIVLYAVVIWIALRVLDDIGMKLPGHRYRGRDQATRHQETAAQLGQRRLAVLAGAVDQQLRRERALRRIDR